jgi:multicomponent K+:H+ antiporter subunit A
VVGDDRLGVLVGVLAALHRACFFGKRHGRSTPKAHDPGIGLWLSPTLLVALVILIGLFPENLLGLPVRMAAGAVIAAEVPKFYLALWHGVDSGGDHVGCCDGSRGDIVAGLRQVARGGWNQLPSMEAKPIFDLGIGLAGLSQVTTRLHNGSLQRYLFVTMAASLSSGW